jgi:hypothetical protein
MLRTVDAVRYVTPFREGGSVPALVEADDDGLYVVKLRGAGQGAKALIAELVAGELARAVGLAVPELVLVELDAAFGRAEPDPELCLPLEQSAGLNLGLDYLPGKPGEANGQGASHATRDLGGRTRALAVDGRARWGRLGPPPRSLRRKRKYPESGEV